MGLDDVRELPQDRAGDASDLGSHADVEAAVELRVDADVVAGRPGGGGLGAVHELALEVFVLEDVAELLRAPVGDEELHAGAGAQAAVAVVAEDRRDAVPDLGDLLERDPGAEPLREHRVGGQPATDQQVEARSVFGVDDSGEGDVVDLGDDVVARVAADRRLELAGEVGERRVTDVAALDLLDRRGAVDDLVGGDAGDGGAEDGAGAVAARLLRREPDALEPLQISGCPRPDPVVLDVLAIGQVRGVAAELGRDAGDRPELGESSRPPSMRTRSMKKESSSSSGSSVAVLPPSIPGALGVEPHQRKRPRRSAGSIESKPRLE